MEEGQLREQGYYWVMAYDGSGKEIWEIAKYTFINRYGWGWDSFETHEVFLQDNDFDFIDETVIKRN